MNCIVIINSKQTDCCAYVALLCTLRRLCQSIVSIDVAMRVRIRRRLAPSSIGYDCTFTTDWYIDRKFQLAPQIASNRLVACISLLTDLLACQPMLLPLRCHHLHHHHQHHFFSSASSTRWRIIQE